MSSDATTKKTSPPAAGGAVLEPGQRAEIVGLNVVLPAELPREMLLQPSLWNWLLQLGVQHVDELEGGILTADQAKAFQEIRVQRCAWIMRADHAGADVPKEGAEVSAGGKLPAAVELGRRGGLKGGPARAANMSPEARKESGRKAAAARWQGRQADLPGTEEPPQDLG